jgi:hypothetical protein
MIKPVCAVSLINVKGLIDELTSGPSDSKSIQVVRSNSIESLGESSPIAIRPRMESNASTSKNSFGKKSIDYLKNKIQSLQIVHEKTQKNVNRVDQPIIVANEIIGEKLDTQLVGVLVSCLMPWGVDPDLDRFCEMELNLKQPAVGTIGCKGYFRLI